MYVIAIVLVGGVIRRRPSKLLQTGAELVDELAGLN